jgi:hypothetical protein
MDFDLNFKRKHQPIKKKVATGTNTNINLSCPHEGTGLDKTVLQQHNLDNQRRNRKQSKFLALF